MANNGSDLENRLGAAALVVTDWWVALKAEY